MNLPDSGPYRHSACSGRSDSAGRSVEARERSWEGVRRKICSSIGLRSSNNERSDAGDGGRRRRWEIGVGRLGEATWGFRKDSTVGEQPGETYRMGETKLPGGGTSGRHSGGVDQGANPPCEPRCRFDAESKCTRRANEVQLEWFGSQVANAQQFVLSIGEMKRRRRRL